MRESERSWVGEGDGSELERGFRKNSRAGETELALFGCCDVLVGCWG